MSEIKVACFDVDGHLANTIPALKKNHRKLYEDLHGGESPSDAFMNDVGTFVGRSGEEVFRRLYPGLFMGISAEAQGEVAADLLKKFGRLALHDPHPARPIHGVPRELKRLHAGVDEMYLVTNRRRETLDRVLRRAGINPALFTEDHIYASERVKSLGDTKAGALLEIKQRHGVTHDQMSMSGDDFNDVQAALDAGVRAFFVPRPDLSRGERRVHMRQAERMQPGEVMAFRNFQQLGQTALLPVA